MTSSPEQQWAVGPDKVWVENDRLFILAKREMDWPVREFSRPPIYFRGHKFYLRAKSKPEGPFAMRYELWSWPEDYHGESPTKIHYDEAYVAERDAGFRDERLSDWMHKLLLPVYPFLGFCWSGFKGRRLVAWEFNPASVNGASLILAFNLFVLEAIFTGWLQGGLAYYFFGLPRVLDIVMLFALAADVAVRFSILMADYTRPQPGFLEWVFRRRTRREPF